MARNNGGLAGFDDIQGLPVIQVWDTVVARAVHGERQSLAVVELEPDAIVPSTGTRTSSSGWSFRAR
jgi:hypothetical protein